ncbi:hypothetical protein IB276_32935 [Ensifer sp. ENS04]|uniref:hypothetical protein n=1 Tax=Ensifer sp. ENS04 TaxID=2769281 RepID=UPI0017825453|nr:hypothetical protein [Ensifer sp. ENS04]MBD9544252.1 hypothetical protein [Ensifer sp. ENS04]
MKAKDSVFTIKLEQDLRDAFVAEAALVDRPASSIMRDLMRDYVERRRLARRNDSANVAELEPRRQASL